MSEPVADAATAIATGCRDRQEDAVLASFSGGAETGFAVLSDGMGGHYDGDLAARVIVTEMSGAISLSERQGVAETTLRARLLDAVGAANRRLRDQVAAGSGQEGMGGTVITAVVQDEALSWVSVGDSALYLFRDGALSRLNANHSLGPQIDMLVDQGMMDAETARGHPQRGCLTSALVGAAINSIDCPTDPVALQPGDILLMASDGLEVLGHARISDILRRSRKRASQHIACALMEAVAAARDPDQDNVSVVVIKPRVTQAVAAPAHRRASPAAAWHAPLRMAADQARQTLIAALRGRPAP